jgi:bacillithiol biosynthesis cysteine-adding enzyme BshC
MDCSSTLLSYHDTGYFSLILSEYIRSSQSLDGFYKYPVSYEGIEQAIADRKKFPVDRQLLVEQLRNQYAVVPSVKAVDDSIALLSHENTFTICTAHQPALFTGSLFFVYKIIHAIKLAADLKNRYPEYNFVPVYYMGCEDADLDELGQFYLHGELLRWTTKQTGAVGRMKPTGLETLLSRIEGELLVLPHGRELMSLLQNSYSDSPDVSTATFKLVHALFAAHGLVTLIPDNPAFKKKMLKIFSEDIFENRPSSIVSETIAKLEQHYKIQAQPRPINLFYLSEGIRERIEKDNDVFRVVGHDISFTEHELRVELEEHPERFSPNVILRGMFQETILPDIAFIGGGGELSYWLELKSLFEHFNVFYPMLVVRNSFLFIERKWRQKMDAIGVGVDDLFQSEQSLLKKLVMRESQMKLTLVEEINDAEEYYDHIQSVAKKVDDTLVQHVSALKKKAIRPLHELEKKLLRAEKKKFEAHERQLRALKSSLFPANGLQERIDNFMPFYAKFGSDFLECIHQHSLSLEQRFTVLTER